MNWMRLFVGQPRRFAGHGMASFRSQVTHAAWLAITLAGLAMLGASGCAHHRIPDFQRGNSCSARKVQQYAKEHNLTYEQALDQLRKEDARKRDEEEARQEKMQQKDKTSSPEDAPARVGGVQLEGYRQGKF